MESTGDLISFTSDTRKESYFLTLTDTMSEDWLIEEKEVTVTRSQLAKAWDKHVGANLINPNWFSNQSLNFKALCKELGLEE